ALLAGFAWGWIPCGMVYATLPLALIAGGWARGAAVMLAFGLGTLPNLVLLDLAAAGAAERLRRSPARTWLRALAGAAVLAFGVSDLAHAAYLAGVDDPTVALLASICHRS
ncbi:MAG TPA: sulfite exporter TauE/SafE family protein, partial [Burkholderiaceae bacterium]